MNPRPSSFVRAVVLAVFGFTAAAAAKEPLWVAGLSGDGPQQVYGMAIDPWGHVYVAGYAQRWAGNGSGLLVKYDQTGKQLWSTGEAEELRDASLESIVTDAVEHPPCG